MKQREFTADFKREAVRILTTSGRSISSVAEDFGIGKSTLDRWRRNFAEKNLLSGPHEDMSQELARLRKENELLRQERDLLKKRDGGFNRSAQGLLQTYQTVSHIQAFSVGGYLTRARRD